MLGPTISPILRYLAWGIGVVNVAGMARIAASMSETCDYVMKTVVPRGKSLV